MISSTKLQRLLFVGITLAGVGATHAEPNRVAFPDNIDELIHYTTFTRNEEERMLTTRAAIEAAQAGQPMPDGTHVVIQFWKDDAITRYFVMQKGAGWGADYDEARRTGDWQFQYFNADGTVREGENSARCQACHQSRADDQYQFMYSDLLSHQLD